MIPVYLTKLKVINGLSESALKIMSNTSFAIMMLALLIGAFIVLKAIWIGLRAEKKLSMRKELKKA
jgi:hypothetical protein